MITTYIKFARYAFITEISTLLRFKWVAFKPFDNKNNSINKQCKNET